MINLFSELNMTLRDSASASKTLGPAMTHPLTGGDVHDSKHVCELRAWGAIGVQLGHGPQNNLVGATMHLATHYLTHEFHILALI